MGRVLALQLRGAVERERRDAEAMSVLAGPWSGVWLVLGREEERAR